MGKLLMNSQRPEDIKLDSTNVNEIYCDGILVWKRESTFKNTYATSAPYLSASSRVRWTANDTSNEQVSYKYYSASEGSGSYEIDLSSIPQNATIIEATVTWYYGIDKPTSGIPSSAYSGSTTKIYFNQDTSNYTTIYGENSDKKLTCTNSIIPGAINSLNLSYQQKGKTFSAANNGTNLYKTCVCTLSNITLTIKYKV